MNNLQITDKGIINCDQSKGYDLNKDLSVYEVFRLIQGTALFLEDHYDRLISSVQMSGIRFKMEYPEFELNIKQLSHLNGQLNGNVKFVLSGDNQSSQWSFSFIPHAYPSAADYREGVATGLLYAERENPNAKIVQNTVRDKANQLMADKKLYEVLLVDKNRLIREGSRSNVFFVKDDCFYTAPTSLVLAGVTRKKVLECIREMGSMVVEEAVKSTVIASCNAAFISGTSPKVLPVNRIDDHVFHVDNPLVEQLMIKYDSVIEDYIASKKH
ncbi:MAG: aminotransferase class IV family protein [Verrucomicrobia bacterium]|nr:aminotransferase class IV family protein [Prolixibacteraceae bacterium]